MARKVLSTAQLYAALDREFRKLRPPQCHRCRIPLPFWRAPPDEVSANWHIGTPGACPEGCDRVIAEILARMWSQYDIEDPTGST